MSTPLLGLMERLVSSIERIAAWVDRGTSAVGPHPMSPGGRETDPLLREAMERYERDLPLTADQVARVLNISPRSVRRLLAPLAKSGAGGTCWYSRKQIDAIWRARGAEKGQDAGFRKAPKRQLRAGRTAADKRRPPLRIGPNLDALEQRLREGTQEDNTGARRRPPKLRLVRSPAGDSET